MKIGDNKAACCLSIAGFDPTGGSGILADILNFTRLGAWGTAAVTLLTAQGNERVSRVYPVSPGQLASQIDSILADLSVRSVKIGALGTRENIRRVAKILEREKFDHVVIETVLRARDGTPLLEEEGAADILDFLLHRATIITPNLMEASAFTGIEITRSSDMESAAGKLGRIGARAVLLKGGHLRGDPKDLLYEAGEYTWLPGMKRVNAEIHGTGCMLSSALCALLAQGYSLLDSVLVARDYVRYHLIRSDKLPRWKYRILK